MLPWTAAGRLLLHRPPPPGVRQPHDGRGPASSPSTPRRAKDTSSSPSASRAADRAMARAGTSTTSLCSEHWQAKAVRTLPATRVMNALRASLMAPYGRNASHNARGTSPCGHALGSSNVEPCDAPPTPPVRARFCCWPGLRCTGTGPAPVPVPVPPAVPVPVPLPPPPVSGEVLPGALPGGLPPPPPPPPLEGGERGVASVPAGTDASGSSSARGTSLLQTVKLVHVNSYSCAVQSVCCASTAADVQKP